MKKLALFTTFFETESGYSLIGVAETQLRSLLDHGYDPRVLVQDNFESKSEIWQPHMIDLRSCVPFMHLERGVAESFEERVERIRKALDENLDGIEVCITHDIILQDFYKEHNVAMRRYAISRPDLLWLNWIHSCPTPSNMIDYPENCRYTPPPGYIIYPNDNDRGLVCQTYRLDGQEWRVKVCRAGHAIDPLLIGNYDPLTVDLVIASDLLGGDIVAVYPARLDRGKQPEKIIHLMAGVKKIGYRPRLLIIDWQSSGQHFQRYINQLLKLARKLGLENEVCFSSRLDDRCSQGVPRRVVLELMDLTNIYVHPSRIETYSLVVHEALLRGNLLVLNHDLPAMRELFGHSAIYMDFGSDRQERNYQPNEQAFWDDEARRLAGELVQNRALMGKTKAARLWSPEALWVDFEPLLYLMPVGEA